MTGRGVKKGTKRIPYKKEENKHTERFCGARYTPEDFKIIEKALKLSKEKSLAFVRDAVMKKAKRKIKQFEKKPSGRVL